MTNKRKVEWDEVQDKSAKAAKRVQEEFREERLQILKSVTADVHAQLREIKVGNDAWVWDGHSRFEKRPILAQTTVEGPTNNVLCFVTNPNGYEDVEIDQVPSDMKLNDLMVLPVSLQEMTCDETLKLYREIDQTLGLNLKFVEQIE